MIKLHGNVDGIAEGQVADIQKAIDKAQKAIDKAQAVSNSLNSAIEQLNTALASVSDVANTAKTVADKATTVANTAKTTATNAQATANKAVSSGGGAIKSADISNNKVNNTHGNIEFANGLKIMYGECETTNSRTYIDFPNSFSGYPIVMFAVQEVGSGSVDLGANLYYTKPNQFAVSHNKEANWVQWIAIGL